MSNLKAFLVDKNLPLKVWISEDSTRITAQIQYDASTNQIVGLVQKPNSLTGFPDTFSYPAESASQTENFITSNHVLSLSYVNMAQPFNLNAPLFCLPIYGKDNKFTSDEVLFGWRTILKEAEDVGIEVLGVSSDGDSCLLKSISITSKLPYAVLELWILESDKYTLKENCITYNCYTCLELNGHALIVILERLREICKEELFLPWLFSSQVCKSVFEDTRLKRIQLQSDVVNVCSNYSRYLMKFPRNQPNRDIIRNIQSLPDKNEINVVVLRAKDTSIKDAINLRMETTDDLRSILPPLSISSEANYCEETLDEKREVNVQNSTANIEFFENNDIGGFTREDLTLLQSCGGLNLKDYSKEYNKESLLQTSGFVVVTTKCGRTIIVRKTSLCLILSESSLKLSSDRSKRVKQNDTTLRNIHKEKNDKSEHFFEKKEKIQIDEWVDFSKSDVGLVLGFSSYRQGEG
ncbi:hypothetical protein FQA39_LY13331 [Lamprigera yunnana]|nr:hypothetical protein FQA39_LY13331 [Lamprigera yunnana]